MNFKGLNLIGIGHLRPDPHWRMATHSYAFFHEYTLSRVFRAHFGMPPGAFRKRQTRRLSASREHHKTRR